MDSKLLRATCALFCLCVTLPALAANPNWSGTWKLDHSKSKPVMDTMTFTEHGNGFRYLDGDVRYDFTCDGKEFPTMYGYVDTCTAAGDGYDLTSSLHGKVLRKWHRGLSADGKTLTIKGVSYEPDGSTESFTDVYKRVSGTKGLAGTWQEQKEENKGEESFSFKLNGDVLHMVVPAIKLDVNAKLDGTDVPVTGPTVPAGASLSVRQEGENKLHLSYKLNGKIIDESTYTLSPDGKTLTELSWETATPAKKSMDVWAKQ